MSPYDQIQKQQIFGQIVIIDDQKRQNITPECKLKKKETQKSEISKTKCVHFIKLLTNDS